MVFGTLVILVFFICLHELYAWYRARRLPPGMSGLRCLFEIPKEKPWLKLLEFNQRYGDIASFSLFGYNIILVNSAKIADDLLEKRGVNHSDRPRSVMGGELSGWSKTMLLADYTDWFRTQRKWVAQAIGSHTAVAQWHEMIETETRHSLQLVLEQPDKIRTHIRRNFVSILLRLSHGYVMQEGDDPMVGLAELAGSQLAKATAAGEYYVDLFPFLKYIPSWFPGAGFKKEAEEFASVLHAVVEIPHNYVLSQLAAGTALPSLSARLLSMPDLTGELRDNIKWTGWSMYPGGVDTSTSAIHAFYLAMTLYPHVMKKAQEELDSVIGTRRLPTFDDRPYLPYLEAVVTELLRWHPPVPLTLRRAATDDEYEGYSIPVGAYVVVNIWAILRDERTYTSPLEFKPERFMGADPEPHPWNVYFGFGRRKCPGLFLAHASMWLMCAQSLAAFDISKHVENGVEVTPAFHQVGGTVIHQTPFKCSIKPRTATAERIIREGH